MLILLDAWATLPACGQNSPGLSSKNHFNAILKSAAAVGLASVGLTLRQFVQSVSGPMARFTLRAGGSVTRRSGSGGRVVVVVGLGVVVRNPDWGYTGLVFQSGKLDWQTSFVTVLYSQQYSPGITLQRTQIRLYFLHSKLIWLYSVHSDMSNEEGLSNVGAKHPLPKAERIKEKCNSSRIKCSSPVDQEK